MHPYIFNIYMINVISWETKWKLTQTEILVNENKWHGFSILFYIIMYANFFLYCFFIYLVVYLLIDRSLPRFDRYWNYLAES